MSKLTFNAEPTTIQQRLELITELRENFDQSERLRITTNRPPEQVAQLLRDIHQDLLGMRNFQLGCELELCSDCNKPMNESNPKVVFGTDENHIVVHPNDKVCEDCTIKRLERLNNSTVGIP